MGKDVLKEPLALMILYDKLWLRTHSLSLSHSLTFLSLSLHPFKYLSLFLF